MRPPCAKTAEALAAAHESGDDLALIMAENVRGIALLYQDGPERDAGVALLAKVRGDTLRERFSHPVLPFIDVELARQKASSGDLDGAIELSRPYPPVRELPYSTWSCCGCARCLHGRRATSPPTGIWWIATGRWRNRSVTRAISRWPPRCSNPR